MITDEQRKLRKNGLGATDCSIVMGMNPYTTPYELWMIKTGRMEENTILTEERLRLRNAHEETIAQEYAFRNNVKLRRANNTIFHKQLPFMFCHLDRVVTGQKKIVECKTASGFMRSAWGQHKSDDAPLHYMLQVQHQIACSEYDDADIASLIDVDDYREFPQGKNEKVIAKIEDACEKFWVENVLKDIPPPPTTRGDLKLMYPFNDGNFIEATPEILNIIDAIHTVKEEIKHSETEKEKLEKQIVQFIAANNGISCEDKIIATLIADKNGTRRLSIKKRGA
jgi:putative phage-type endonuclease